MASLAKLYRHRTIRSICIESSDMINRSSWCLYPSFVRTRWLSTESTRSQFPTENAYDILGVSHSSSFSEIKASFRKLAKETHPDLAESKNDSASSLRFVQILAAYEILSDSEKRAHYDKCLLYQRKVVQKSSRQVSTMYRYESHIRTNKQMEVVEWLKWYRLQINDILSEKKVVDGTGYFDVLEHDFYSAVHLAYYGPDIESLDLLPDSFEAEERSVNETPEVLHLVSGRDLFGMVCLVNTFPELSNACNDKLPSYASAGLGICQYFQNLSVQIDSGVGDSQLQDRDFANHTPPDAYKDLELHVSGRVVAVATRVPPKSCSDGTQNENAQDHIHVFLNSNAYSMHSYSRFSEDSFMGSAVGRIPLGKISGLGTSPDEGSCFVYNGSGTKTHVIMKHRTLLVKHMHWYGVGDEVSVCECRCSRARLPPSRFWLFEPRCGMHDIGGWYVETYGRDKKGRTVPSQRYWDGFDASEQFESRHIYTVSVLSRPGLVPQKLFKSETNGPLEVILFAVLYAEDSIQQCIYLDLHTEL
ncbi:DnaJ domain-containing protein [Cephalotus follicularis]|uniref:DnaJ domain-containing protein n=1 Tax=Cephalotus follicularis TaxID=3775 RepID=A0A1Q3ASQ3_CEPFO|nr:DnaJ domain-containing protein [Cephalotus follicularis]